MAATVYTFGEQAEDPLRRAVVVPPGAGLTVHFDLLDATSAPDGSPEDDYDDYDASGRTWTLAAHRRASGEAAPAYTLTDTDGLTLTGLQAGKIVARLAAERAGRSKGVRVPAGGGPYLWLALRATNPGEPPWLVATLELRRAPIESAPALPAAGQDAPLVIRVPILVPAPAEVEVSPLALTSAPPPIGVPAPPPAPSGGGGFNTGAGGFDAKS